MNKYSLWLVPNDNDKKKLQEIIDTLSYEYKTPGFIPHLTLLGSIPGEEEGAIISVAHALRTQLMEVPVYLASVESSEKYYKTIHIAVARTPALLKAHQTAKSVCGHIPSEYTPHISLMYGHLPKETRTIVQERVAPLVPLDIILDKLHLVDTTNDAPSWKTLGVYQL